MLASLQTSFETEVYDARAHESFPAVVHYHWDGAEVEVLGVIRTVGELPDSRQVDVLGDLSHAQVCELMTAAEADAHGLVDAVALADAESAAGRG